MSDIFLHDHPEFKNLIHICAEEQGIIPQLIEKDYWIMHCLWGLQQQGFDFELKGGTSLSKGYKVIDRFSEDIDIKIIPPANKNVPYGKNHNDQKHRHARSNYFDELANEIKIDGTKTIRDHSYDDKKFRNAGIVLKYNSIFESVEGVKDGILLEVGFDTTTPNYEKTISSWALDHAISLISIKDTKAKNVKCFAMSYTFVEKLQAISKRHRKYKDSGNKPSNFLRHYYDVYCLLNQQEVQLFIPTDDYRNYKKDKFQQDDEKVISMNPAFSLTTEEIKEYNDLYIANRSLYYKGQVPFNNILARINEYKDKL